MSPCLPTELIHHIIDFLVDHVRSLHQLSLVDKAFSAYARHCLFRDLSINICRDPYIATHACRTPRCIKKLVLLLKMRVPPTIPRRVRTLSISGKAFPPLRYRCRWRIVSNPGAMDDESVTVPVLGYFKEVEELHLVRVNLYPPSSWALFRLRSSTFLSSVRTVVLDRTRFYAGPAMLHSFLSQMPNLDHLCINEVSWPSQCGFPNNASAVYVLLLNFPRTFGPLRRVWDWSRGVKETLFPQQWKPIPCFPSHLTVDIRDPRGALSWMTMPALSEMLNKLLSLKIYYSYTKDRDDLGDGTPEFILDQLLASVPNIVHLTFRWWARPVGSSGTLFRPNFSSCRSLQTLHLQGVNAWDSLSSWVFYREWLHSTMRSLRDLPLEHVQVTMDLDVTDISFEGIDTQTVTADESLCREGLNVEARIGLYTPKR